VAALGQFQQQTLYALLRLGDKAYGMRIWEELEERTEGSVAVGAVYATLERLQNKGYVSSHLGEPTPERGGRAKRYYTITGTGARALQETEQAFVNLRAWAPREQI